ncbi:MAG TPA: glycosyltransferase family 9 protein [Candidatus Paceibacterota bacterium]
MSTYNKTRTLLLLLLSLIFFIFCGFARKRIREPKRVVSIYLTKNIGDVIFATPVFRALKEKYPNCHISFIGKPKNKEMLAFNPDIDEYIICPDSPFVLWKTLRRLNADYAFLFTTSSMELAFLYVANIPTIGVFSLQNINRHTISYEILKRFCVQIPFYSGKNFAIQNLTLLSPLGIHSNNVKKHLYYSPQAEETITHFLERSNMRPARDLLVGIAPGAGTKVKQWPAEKFAQLADHIAQKYSVPLFIVGGPGDKAEFEEMQAAVSHSTNLISCLDQSIDELKAFVSKIDIIIANDSAPIYIGETFNKATVVIVGPTDEKEHPPIGVYHRTVVGDKNRKPAMPSMLAVAIDDKEARKQIESISVEQVISAVDELIHLLKNK